MAIWTVDTWRVAPARESHFLRHCRGLTPESLILYRDVEDEGLFWSPAKWASLKALREWRSCEAYISVLRVLNDDVIDHQSHIMTDVPGFLPQASDSG
jgi:hypothetical protein